MRLAWLLMLAACDGSASGDITGPFTGATRTYYVDGVTLPTGSIQAHDLGDDLNGDKVVDNQLGAVFVTLASQGDDLNKHTADIYAAGVIRSVLELQDDDPMAIGITLRGDPSDTSAQTVGASLQGGVIISNRTATSGSLGSTMIHLPALVDADPTVFPLDYMEVTLTSDGHDGYNAAIRGLAPRDPLQLAAATSLVQMMNNNPADHADLIRLMQLQSGDITVASVMATGLFMSLLGNDLTRNGKPYVSAGFALHFSPTPPSGPPADTCFDRLLDGDETAVDCGGSCVLACPT